MECPLAILHPKNNKQNLVISVFVWDALNAPADKQSQFYCVNNHRQPLVGTGSADDAKTLAEAIA